VVVVATPVVVPVEARQIPVATPRLPVVAVGPRT